MKRILAVLSLLASTCPATFASDGVNPVPEPGSLILLGTAAAGIGYVAWRRKRNN
jgi:hypothetical protein